jgi:hypothetical protein
MVFVSDRARLHRPAGAGMMMPVVVAREPHVQKEA